jgi:hypothetical protein
MSGYAWFSVIAVPILVVLILGGIGFLTKGR